MNSNKPKLILKVETLRALTDDTMHVVRGGVSAAAEAADLGRLQQSFGRCYGSCVPGCTQPPGGGGGQKTFETLKLAQ